MSSVVRDASAIPVVDFAQFLDGSRKQEVADAIIKSFRDIGFVYLINHGRPQEKIDAMFELVRAFPWSISFHIDNALYDSRNVSSHSPRM